MEVLFKALAPEITLIASAAIIFLFGTSGKAAWRVLAPSLCIAALTGLFVFLITGSSAGVLVDPHNVVRVDSIALYFKTVVAGVGILLVLLAWPTLRGAKGNPALDTGEETAEFFALMLLSLAGVMLVASANDLILLFLAIELASIPTYVMVSISRPLPVAQEAGVKYFFLGAMSAALMLFGFSYLYGMTGQTHLDQIGLALQDQIKQTGGLSNLSLLAVLLSMAGFAFKMAAFPLHFYAADVYQGAATPVTAFLSFVPKATGVIALLKVLSTVGGPDWIVPDALVTLLLLMSIITMTIGNTLALLQQNVKRVMAYSSVAHSGYLLAGVTAIVASRQVQEEALAGVMFYLAAYGIMNACVFGGLILLPSRTPQPSDGPSGTSAETYEDLQGMGRHHVALGIAMAIGCFSLTGLPFTVGFFGKAFLILPALSSGESSMVILVIALVINAAISSGYYLKIVGTMFLRNDPSGPPSPAMAHDAGRPLPIQLAVTISAGLTIGLGVALPVVQKLTDRISEATHESGESVKPIASSEKPE